MDDITFFDTILPSQGLRCIALVKPTGAWHHVWGDTNHWLAATSKQIDTSRNIDVYYGCSSFAPQAQDTARDPTTRKLVIGGRKQTNVLLVRSFFVDLDVGVSEPGKPPKYADQKTAARTIFKFAVDHKLPLPWLVNSGWGVHVYWPMDADMLASDWKPVAQALKRALAAAGVLFDPTRTADEASVLRPLGTRNHKGKPKPVKLVAVGDIGTLPAFQQALAPWMQEPSSAPIGTAKLSAQNSALGGGMGPDPSSAHLMAQHCAVMGLMRDTKGNVDQPTWYHSLGVLRQTDEAPAICHEWSAGHPNYTAAETNAKLAQLADHGATTCAKLADHQRTLCMACPHFGTITSPIQLGRDRIEKATVERVERVVDKKGFVTETAVKLDLPYGYGETVQDGHRVLTFKRKVTAKDGTVSMETDVVANTLFWGITRLWVDDVSAFEFEMITREGPRRFTIKGGTIGAGGRELSSALAENEIVARRGQGPQLQSYVSNWLEVMTKNSDQVKAHRSFGWSDDDFVLGDSVIQPDGSEHRAVLMGVAKNKEDVVCRSGDLQTWVALVDRAYNAPGQEAFQFQLGCAFGAPLLSLMQQVKGVTVYSHTDGSGVGKTTVQKVGLSAWGYPDDMMLAHGKTTANALWGLLGAYQSLPVVYDELTLAPVADVSELVFSVSSGRAKERMTASGEVRANNSNWSTIMLASGNKLLSEMLAGFRANTEAEVSRLFEFTLEASPHLSVVEANAIFPQFLNHYGHAGHAFARFVTKNRPKIVKALHAEQTRLIEKLGLTQVERHWSALFASVMVALHVCRALKLMAFDPQGVEDWMTNRLDENRFGRNTAVVSHDDLLSQMIDELWDGVLVTDGQGDLRSGTPVHVLKDPRGPVIGRMIRPVGSIPTDLLISRTAINEWCKTKMTSPSTLFTTALAKGWVHPKVDRHGLGRGVKTYQTTNNIHCWRFFPDAMADSPAAAVLSMVAGGKP